MKKRNHLKKRIVFLWKSGYLPVLAVAFFVVVTTLIVVPKPEEKTDNNPSNPGGQISESGENTDDDDNDTSEEMSKNPEEKDPYRQEYGIKAKEYMAFIDRHFPKRTNGYAALSTENKEKCGEWIFSMLRDTLGYSDVRTYRYQNEREGVLWTSTSYAARKPGRSPKRIVIGAHYDSVDTNGADDNASGVGMVLELAERFREVDLPVTVDFCFFDGEEVLGYAGSYSYLETEKDWENILLYINVDSIAAGDFLLAAGGDWEEGKIVRSFGYQMAMAIAEKMEISLESFPVLRENSTTPCRTTSSDQYYFNANKIPYVYFSANRWVNLAGIEPESPDGSYYRYNTSAKSFSETRGQIIHTRLDSVTEIERRLPGRIDENLSAFSRLLTGIVNCMTVDAETKYSNAYPLYTEEFFEDIALIGDSRFVALGKTREDGYGLISDSHIFATHGGRLTYETSTEDALRAAKEKPEKAFFWFGINDVQTNPDRDNTEIFIENYAKVLDAFHNESPDTTIYLVSILSTSVLEKDYYDSQEENIRKYNEALKKYAKEKGYRYWDCTDLFGGEESFKDDCIHFIREWYENRFLPALKKKAREG